MSYYLGPYKGIWHVGPMTQAHTGLLNNWGFLLNGLTPLHHKDPSHNPRQGLMVQQTHIHTRLDRTASQPLLHRLPAAAGSHLCRAPMLEAREGEKTARTANFNALVTQVVTHSFMCSLGCRKWKRMRNDSKKKKKWSGHRVIYACA